MTLTNDELAQLKKAAAAYEDEKTAADQAVAKERESGIPANTVNFSVRLPMDTAVRMRAAAAKQNIPTSMWLRQLITTAVAQPQNEPVTDAHIEAVVRRILAEEHITAR